MRIETKFRVLWLFVAASMIICPLLVLWKQWGGLPAYGATGAVVAMVGNVAGWVWFVWLWWKATERR